ncbi:hypothetical protein BGZ52_002985, partial [Haplosporangium bisporale]
MNHLNANTNNPGPRGPNGFGSSSGSGGNYGRNNNNNNNNNNNTAANNPHSGRHHPHHHTFNNQAQVRANPGSINPYWPEYHQGPGDVLPLNLFVSPTNQTIPPASRPPQRSNSKSTTMTKPNTMNQNQVHAQTHPWRIKVYNACLACRKKKIKCDGLPTCKRCERMGFECSYIEVPQTPQSKAKQTTTTEPSHQPAASKSFAQDRPGGGRQANTETSKELHQQRRSSIKDAASGSLPHTAMRRKDPPEDSTDVSMDTNPSFQFSGKDMRYGSETTQRSQPTSAFVMEQDTTMPDLYHILVNSVTIPNVSKFTQGNVSLPSGLMGMDNFNITPPIPTFTVMNQDHTDSDQYQSFFQKDPASIPDQSTPLGFVITNKSVIQYLVHVYFECFHGHWMIVDKDKFLAQLKDPSSPPDPLLLVAICAAGAKYSDHEGLCAEPGNMSTIGEQFLTHARILLQDRFDVPSMSTLQALLILYWCQVQTGRASLRFMYVGMAIRMAQEMGLNRPMDPKRLKEMDNREVQIRKTIWWSCYQADRWTSAALGKPMVISDVDCVVDYPSSVDESHSYAVQSFSHMTDLAKILGKVIINLYTSTTAATCSSAVFSHLDQSLSSWIESLSSTSDQDKNAPNPRRYDDQENMASPRVHQDAITSGNAAGYYALLFHTVRIMLYRPFLHNSALVPVLPLTLQSPLSRCRESAVAISELAENLVTNQKSYRQLFNSIHVSLCAAATVHRFAISSPKPSDDSSGDSTVDPSQALSSPANNPTTLSKAPPTGKTDLYYLALLLRILQHCSRFSVEKNQLHSILDNFIPHRHLDPES